MASAADKFTIPFFYATAENAGVSGEGEGFFWQQNNNIFEDSKKGMVRIGKEYDDVEVISETTGEWEFPYDSGADFYSLDINMGHASGGESHGCEGAHYMVFVTINETPPRFYFAKQMYHGGTKYEHSIGKFTHPSVTEKVVGNGWKGIAAVRYNVKDGRSAGHDSVVIELWWNDDPDNHIKDGWFKVKSVEDKGGWGSGGDTCGGVSDQVITWSAVQWRFKSGTPEWSVHPIIPEFEDGDNIHCIDEEDLCFSASEKRGYCKNERIPRDTEQKVLFKFAANDGIARLKNASLREIDPLKSLDETPSEPDPTQQPGETVTIQGKFKLQWDLNSNRISACAGTGLNNFYDVTTQDAESVISDHATYLNRTGIVERVVNTSGNGFGKKPISFDIPLKKAGTPGASPTVTAQILDTNLNVIYTSPTTFDPSTFTTSYVTKTFDFSTNTRTLAVGDMIGVFYTGTSSSNYVVAGYTTTNQYTGMDMSWIEDGAKINSNGSELTCTIYE